MERSIHAYTARTSLVMQSATRHGSPLLRTAPRLPTRLRIPSGVRAFEMGFVAKGVPRAIALQCLVVDHGHKLDRKGAQ
jgi:hypothetical protein